MFYYSFIYPLFTFIILFFLIAFIAVFCLAFPCPNVTQKDQSRALLNVDNIMLSLNG